MLLKIEDNKITPMMLAQQGNKVFVVVVLKPYVEGMEIINLNSQVLRVDLDGEPTLRVNNTLHGFDRLPMRLS